MASLSAPENVARPLISVGMRGIKLGWNRVDQNPSPQLGGGFLFLGVMMRLKLV